MIVGVGGIGLTVTEIGSDAALAQPSAFTMAV
jgi:hypothetical protein